MRLWRWLAAVERHTCSCQKESSSPSPAKTETSWIVCNTGSPLSAVICGTANSLHIPNIFLTVRVSCAVKCKSQRQQTSFNGVVAGTEAGTQWSHPQSAEIHEESFMRATMFHLPQWLWVRYGLSGSVFPRGGGGDKPALEPPPWGSRAAGCEGRTPPLPGRWPQTRSCSQISLQCGSCIEDPPSRHTCMQNVF